MRGNGKLCKNANSGSAIGYIYWHAHGHEEGIGESRCHAGKSVYKPDYKTYTNQDGNHTPGHWIGIQQEIGYCAKHLSDIKFSGL
jgi:hypothetical protein